MKTHSPNHISRATRLSLIACILNRMGTNNGGSDGVDEESVKTVEEAIDDIEEKFGDELKETEFPDDLEAFERNLEDSADEIQGLIDDFKDGEINNKKDVLSHLVKISNTTATTAGTVGGALLGSLLGPAGSIGGAVVGGGTTYLLTRDEKRLIAAPVDESETPEGADIHGVSDIKDQPDVRDLVKNVASTGEIDQEASSLLREIDFDEVRAALNGLGRTETSELDEFPGCYFEHDNQRVVVMIDEEP